jgi:hypothetical protein
MREAPLAMQDGEGNRVDVNGNAEDSDNFLGRYLGVRGWKAYALPLMVFAIVALGHGIYLGINAVDEEEREDERRKAAAPVRIEAHTPKGRRRPVATTT